MYRVDYGLSIYRVDYGQMMCRVDYDIWNYYPDRSTNIARKIRETPLYAFHMTATDGANIKECTIAL